MDVSALSQKLRETQYFSWTGRATSAERPMLPPAPESPLEASRDDAVTDPLTGLGNRRAFKSHLEEILPSVTLKTLPLDEETAVAAVPTAATDGRSSHLTRTNHLTTRR